jgi:tetratricopeptide (TPR) repeat protein
LLGGLAVVAALGRAEPPAKIGFAQRIKMGLEAGKLSRQAEEHFDRGEYPAAVKLAERSLAIYRQLYPKDKNPRGHLALARAINNLGIFLQAQGEYARAHDYLKQAFAMCEQLYPKTRFPRGHPDLANTLNNMGSLLHDQGDYGRALDYFKRALAMNEQLYPQARFRKGHPDLVLSFNNLGNLFKQQGDLARARENYQRALDMNRRLFPRAKYPQGHPELAASFSNLGALLTMQGEYARAREYLREALEMRQRLHPRAKFPRGHSQLAANLINLGTLLRSEGEYARALMYYKQALEMNRRLYPKADYPRGHPALAVALTDMGSLLNDMGEYPRALESYKEAVAIYRRFYPPADYPRGQPDLATCLNTMGNVLASQGEFARAREVYQQALEMRRRLYPKAEYPRGHPDLADCLNNLGNLFKARGDYTRAQGYYKEALETYERLYRKADYPRGHHNLAAALNNLGALLRAQGKYAEAQGYQERVLKMKRRMYPRAEYPHGTTDIALTLNNLGFLLHARGDYTGALDFYKEAMAMNERLYPRADYPRGHPQRAASLTNLGSLLAAQGKFREALPHLAAGLRMRQDLFDVFVAGASEAEAFSFAANVPLARDAYLSAAGHVPGTADACYRFVWQGKAAVTRLLEGRHRAIIQAAASSSEATAAEKEKIRASWQKLQRRRRELARLLLAPSGKDKAGIEQLQTLTKEKEDLEQQLAKLLPAFAREQALGRLGPGDLIKQLPARTVFIDLLNYIRIEQDPKVPGHKGEKLTPCYVAFVLRRGAAIRRVELGPAAAVDNAVADWRKEIEAEKAEPSAGRLRRLVWEPLAKYLPADTQAVFLAPDGDLCRLPWAALPGKRKGTVLLEDHALAVVPHGPFVLQRLRADPVREKDPGLLVAVGGVSYGEAPAALDRPPNEAFLRSPVVGEKKLSWDDLPGTLQELDKVIGRAGKRLVHRWSGREASTARLMAELPRARWVHLATHGFFADGRFRSALRLNEKLFDPRAFGEGPAPGARNPLVLSGVVLAGANLPHKAGTGADDDDGGILTAEAIAGLPLHRLELAVLSACETGLGRVAGGEGVFGLQRAFHLAGARNVVASLWKVNDQATAALMALFYDKLWRQKKSPLTALREAQLTLYHHPERVGKLARERGANFDKIVRLPITPRGDKGSERGGKAPTRKWAAFVLSGVGK